MWIKRQKLYSEDDSRKTKRRVAQGMTAAGLGISAYGGHQTVKGLSNMMKEASGSDLKEIKKLAKSGDTKALNTIMNKVKDPNLAKKISDKSAKKFMKGLGGLYGGAALGLAGTAGLIANRKRKNK